VTALTNPRKESIMKRHFIYSAILAAAILLTVGVTTSVASPDDSDARVRFSRRISVARDWV